MGNILSVQTFFQKIINGIFEKSNRSADIKTIRQFIWDVDIGELIFDNTFDSSKSIDTVALTAKWNELKTQSIGLFSSLKRVFNDEVAGCVRGLTPQMKQAMALVYYRKTGQIANEEDMADDSRVNKTREAIFQAFKLNKFTVQFPSIGIMAKLHALIGWEKNHKYQEHDMLDIDHASIAAGYCNAFVGERRLCAMMQKNTPSICETYNLDVYPSIDDYINSIMKYRR